MKIFIGPYVNFYGPYQIAEKILFWKDKDEDDTVHDFGTWLATNSKGEDSWLTKACRWAYDKQERKVKIKIHGYDIWSADHTIALIAVPLLKQLQEIKRGAPYVDDEDVPENIRSTAAKPKENEYDTDEFHFQRWDYVLSEMIWSLEQLIEDKENDFFTWDNTQESDILIGKRFGLGKCSIDEEGLDAYNARIQRGNTLFGKYLRACWD